VGRLLTSVEKHRLGIRVKKKKKRGRIGLKNKIAGKVETRRDLKTHPQGVKKKGGGGGRWGDEGEMGGNHVWTQKVGNKVQTRKCDQGITVKAEKGKL